MSLLRHRKQDMSRVPGLRKTEQRNLRRVRPIRACGVFDVWGKRMAAVYFVRRDGFKAVLRPSAQRDQWPEGFGIGALLRASCSGSPTTSAGAGIDPISRPIRCAFNR